MRGLKEVRAQGGIEAGPPPFRSLRPGLSRLVDRLVDRVGSVDIPQEAFMAILESGD